MNNDTLHGELADLAASAEIPCIDIRTLVRAARRRRVRAVAAACALAVAVGGAATAGVISWRTGTEALQPAEDNPSRRLLVPSQDALQAALDVVFPGSTVVRAEEFPAAYLPPGSSAFGGRTRLGGVDASVTLPAGSGLSVQWDALDKPLDDAEAEQFVGYRLDYDRSQPKPAQVLLAEENGTFAGLRLWRISPADGTSRDVLAVWARNGLNVVVTQSLPSATGTARAPSDVALVQLARRLTSPPLAPPPTRVAETDDFGRISDIARDGSWLRVERVDMLSGQEAEAAAAADGRDVANDYYLRERPESWTRYPLSPQVVVWGSIGLSRSVEPARVDLARLIHFIDTDTASRQTLFHVDVEDGMIVGLEEQYRP